MISQMRERLDVMSLKYDELKKEIMLPENLSDFKVVNKLNQEISDIEEAVLAYKEYQKLENNIKESTELLKDPEMAELAKEEIRADEEKMADIVNKLVELLKPKDKNDSKNVIVEIRGAAGGDEANIFAGDLFRMYLKYCEKENWKVEIISEEHSESGGFPLVSFTIKGKNVYSKLKYESGAHRVQRVPTTETQGRVHTSTATVLVMPEQDDIDIEIKPSDIRVDIYRSSGCGGQGVNTTDSAVRLTHLPTNIVVTCQNERSQIQNKETAMKVLKAKIFDYEQEKRDLEIGAERRSKIGTGSRSEKIRTYNYPQNRVTDHRIGFSYMNLEKIMNGDVDIIINALIEEDEKRKLAGEQ